MKEGMFLRVPTMLIVVASLIALNSAAFAIDFTADLTQKQGDQVSSGKIYVTETHYRMDLEQYGEQVIVIVDRAAGMTRVLMPSEKQYIEMESQDEQSVMNDPFQAVIYTIDFGEDKNIGTETVDGYECDKWLLSMMDEPAITRWVSRKLGFTIKIAYHPDDIMTVNLTNITEGAVDASLYEIPDGYALMAAPGEEPVEVPDWAADVPNAPVMTPPFEHTMQSGEMIRIAVTSGKSLAIKGTSTTDTEADVKAVPFKDGKPLDDLYMFQNFAMQGAICDRRHESTMEADEFVVRCFAGEVSLIAKWIDMQERTIKAGRVLGISLQPGKNTEARFVNAGDEDAVCVIVFMTGDEDVSEGPEKYRTIKLKKGESERRALQSDAEALQINVLEGEMHLKLGQYEAFVF